jgi:hypothetical protein
MICCSSLYAQIDPPPPPDGGGGPGGVNDVPIDGYLLILFILGLKLDLAKVIANLKISYKFNFLIKSNLAQS